MLEQMGSVKRAEWRGVVREGSERTHGQDQIRCPKMDTRTTVPRNHIMDIFLHKEEQQYPLNVAGPSFTVPPL